MLLWQNAHAMHTIPLLDGACNGSSKQWLPADLYVGTDLDIASKRDAHRRVEVCSPISQGACSVSWTR